MNVRSDSLLRKNANILQVFYIIIMIIVTVERAREEVRPPRPAAPSPRAPHRPPPPLPTAAPQRENTPENTETTADLLFLNSTREEQKPAEVKREKKLQNEDSFDFFGMMEKDTSSKEFGDFLSGLPTTNTEVSIIVLYIMTTIKIARMFTYLEIKL